MTDTGTSEPFIDETSPFLLPLGYDNLDENNQAYVDRLILLACEQVEVVCNRKFAAEDYEEVHHGNDDNIIFINNPPINTLTSVIINKDEDDEETIPADSLKYNSDIGEIALIKTSSSTSDIYMFSKGYNNLTVNYNGGWVTIPYAIEKIVADMVLEAFDPTLVGGYVTEERIGQYEYKISVTKMSKVLLSHHNLLNRYKIRRVN